MRISDWSSDVCSSDLTPTLEGEYWLMHNQFTQAEGVANLDQVPEAGALIAIGFAKPEGGTGGYARYVAIPPADWQYGVTIPEAPGAPLPRSDARRVGKECVSRSKFRWSP